MVNKKIDLTAALKKYFGFDKFKGDQEAIIQNVPGRCHQQHERGGNGTLPELVAQQDGD